MAWSLPISHGLATGQNAPVTLTIDSTGADFAVARINVGTTGQTVTVTDNNGNTWTGLSVASGAGWTQLWYTQGGTFGSNHQITMTLATGSNPTLTTLEAICFSGSAASPFDAESGTGSIFNATSAQPGSGITPAGANELFICGLTIGGATGTPTIDTGFTIVESNGGGTGGVFWGGSLAYLIYPGASLVNPTWSWSAGSPYCCPMAAFKAGVSAATTFKRFGQRIRGGSSGLPVQH